MSQRFPLNNRSWKSPSFFLLLLMGRIIRVRSFSIQNNSNNNNIPNLGLVVDRFRATCPADITSIRYFDAALVEKEHKDADSAVSEVWVAVYRSNQNQPSVLVRDDFFHAMNAATSTSSDNKDNDDGNNDQNNNSRSSYPSSNALRSVQPIDEKLQTPMALERPVAVARLAVVSPDFSSNSSNNNNSNNKYLLDSMRCALEKESMEDSCDGGSEFLEALSVGIDSLVLYHLQQQEQQQQEEDEDEESPSSGTFIYFDGVIRTKATLFSHQLLEDRGFSPVETLSKDMATHVSDLDGCLEQYAVRSVDTTLNHGARDRALQIVSLLSQQQLLEIPTTKRSGGEDEDDDDDFDPWANFKMQI